MMDLVLETIDFLLKMMDFVLGNDEFCTKMLNVAVADVRRGRAAAGLHRVQHQNG